MSKTETPNFCLYDERDNYYILDCPGLKDTNKEKEFANQNIVQKIMSEAADGLEIIFLMNYSAIDVKRGEGLIEILFVLLRLLRPEAIKNMSEAAWMDVWVNQAKVPKQRGADKKKEVNYGELLKKRSFDKIEKLM